MNHKALVGLVEQVTTEQMRTRNKPIVVHGRCVVFAHAIIIQPDRRFKFKVNCKTKTYIMNLGQDYNPSPSLFST